MKHWQKISLGLSSISLLLLAYVSLRQPQWMFHWVSQLQPGALFFVDTRESVIALTIDDGPHGETTEAILNVLERHGVTATFFMLSDELSGHETVLQRLIDNGHELGNHMTKDEASIGLTSEEFQTKFMMADQALSVYGDVGWFRPGMGWYNDRMLSLVEGQGYQLVLGSLFPYDTHMPSVRFSQWFVLNNLDPGDILVLHDGPKNRGKRTAQLLEQLLPNVQARGYRIVTLSELATYEQEEEDSTS
ncbi:polysaccharide deacetylase family protein [Leptolyngbya cf. ectocarpi LEGE 11479]|uniref:Polysaccharide deacetylase family protein n=1 Tax=Leptolyngbya cf. ectocarpi LEGE 11479 TaxID=1828722 RepID=A0A928ZTW0_LEPEC|nr:chitin deacetylase family protein [Leptolyngbya ectocarpi]MBE9067367.1 polysaccharide deacetylase family protein [Leptolyngbya cf. ectocarpi LEGE 11479]